jgi:hypothetical protein
MTTGPMRSLWGLLRSVPEPLMSSLSDSMSEGLGLKILNQPGEDRIQEFNLCSRDVSQGGVFPNDMSNLAGTVNP